MQKPYHDARMMKPQQKNFAGKKRVSFSDQVEIVAPSEEIVEAFLPNPVLERVLGKAFLTQKGIEN